MRDLLKQCALCLQDTSNKVYIIDLSGWQAWQEQMLEREHIVRFPHCQDTTDKPVDIKPKHDRINLKSE